MNWFLIVGIALTTLGLVSSGIGTIKEYRKDDIHKLKVEGFMNEQIELNKPKLEVVGSQNYLIKIKNVGGKPAQKVKLFVKEINGSDTLAKLNTISGMHEMVKDTEYLLNLNPFSGAELINRLPKTEDSLKIREEAKILVNKFDAGEMLIIRFYLEFYFEDEKNISDTYTFIFNKNGPIGISKD